MSTLVESLKRLYEKGSITTDKLEQMQADGKITADEYAYIVSGSTGGDTADLQAFYDEVTKEVGV